MVFLTQCMFSRHHTVDEYDELRQSSRTGQTIKLYEWWHVSCLHIVARQKKNRHSTNVLTEINSEKSAWLTSLHTVGQKNRPYILLFIVLLYLFTFTNNIPCELKFCSTYIEAQTILVCQQVVQKNYNRVKAPKHHYVTTAKHNSSSWLCLYPSNSSVQQQTVK